MSLRPGVVLFLALALVVGWVASFVIYRAAEVGELVAPLEPRSWSRMTVVAVGTGGPYENPERLGPSLGVGLGDDLLLVDAGRGMAEALRKAQIPVDQPRTVYLTNLLPVNTVGLDDLLLTGWLAPREAPLRLVGPPGTRALAHGLLAAHASAIEAETAALGLPPAGARIEAIEAEDGFRETVGEIEIRAGEIEGGPTPALAWSFEHAGRRVVVSGTGWGTESLVGFAQGAHLLVHEAVYIPDPETLDESGVIADPERLRREAALHTSILDVGKLARRSGVERLMLVRMRPPPFFSMQARGLVDDSYGGEILVPDDGDEARP